MYRIYIVQIAIVVTYYPVALAPANVYKLRVTNIHNIYMLTVS